MEGRQIMANRALVAVHDALTMAQNAIEPLPRLFWQNANTKSNVALVAINPYLYDLNVASNSCIEWDFSQTTVIR